MFIRITISISNNANINTKIATKFSWENAKRNVASSCTSGIFISLLAGCIGGLAVGFPEGILVGIVGGSTGRIATGIAMSFSSKELEVRFKDNQGIWLASWKAFLLGILFSPSGIPLSMSMIYAANGVIDNSSKVVFLGLGLGFVFGAVGGGLRTSCQHLALRVTLRIFSYSPWNYSKFLRYCTKRGLLQRVGGGFRFVHSSLRDHFAELYSNY